MATRSPWVPRSPVSESGPMKDGLYQVTTHYLCAGFVVAQGQVTLCAPILRRKIRYWRTVAIWRSK